jgi:hypothetical protein
MTGVTENYSKSEVRAVVRFLQAEGVSQREIHRRLLGVRGKFIADYWESEGNSSQITGCLRSESFQPKGSVCVVQQI